jgi:Fic family protein
MATPPPATLPSLPLPHDLETKAVLKQLAGTRAALAELKGVALLIPNQAILINTLTLQEAKDSSAIENIVTTHDELFRSDATLEQYASLAAKEVYAYAHALQQGYHAVKTTGLLTCNHLLQVQAVLEPNKAGYRKVLGTVLLNQQTGETIYTPPPPQHVEAHMHNLEAFINDASLCQWDGLVKMAVIHHQFESIHPYYDGNGRTGRILNILYLVQQGLLDSPVLYLSRYINKHKAQYYHLLQAVRTHATQWEAWVLFMLQGVEETALQTIVLVQGIKQLMQAYKVQLRQPPLSKVYSHDLLNLLFNHPYTKTEYVMRELGVHRNTASKYLNALVASNLLTKHRLLKDNYYFNHALIALLMTSHHSPTTLGATP